MNEFAIKIEQLPLLITWLSHKTWRHVADLVYEIEYVTRYARGY